MCLDQLPVAAIVAPGSKNNARLPAGPRLSPGTRRWRPGPPHHAQQPGHALFEFVTGWISHYPE